MDAGPFTHTTSQFSTSCTKKHLWRNIPHATDAISYNTDILYNAIIIVMTDSTEELEKAQNKQKDTGAAGSDPETKTGPAENLREEAAKAVDETEESSEPA